MLTDEQKREYMEVMHQYSDLRSRLEAHKFGKSKQQSVQSENFDTAKTDYSNSASLYSARSEVTSQSPSISAGVMDDKKVVDPAAVNPIGTVDQDRLSALRAKLQI